MATEESATDALCELIEKAAKTAAANAGTNPSAAQRYARVALDAAEALAWIQVPNQPHGGSRTGD